MKNRPCCVRGCNNLLSVDVQSHITMCGNHQLIARQIPIRYPEIRDYSEVIAFMKNHLDGASVDELSELWHIPAHILRGYIRRGRLEAQKLIIQRKDSKRKWIWIVSLCEIARISDIQLGWIATKQAVLELGVKSSTWRDYIRKGLLGEVQTTLKENTRVVKRCDKLKEKVAEIVRLEKELKAIPGRFLEKDEIKLSIVALLLAVSRAAIYSRVVKGELKAYRKGKKLLVTNGTYLRVFLQGILDKTFPSKRKVVIKAKVLVEKHPRLKK